MDTRKQIKEKKNKLIDKWNCTHRCPGDCSLCPYSADRLEAELDELLELVRKAESEKYELVRLRTDG